MKKSGKVILALLALGMAAALYACGGNASSDSTGNSDSVSASSSDTGSDTTSSGDSDSSDSSVSSDSDASDSSDSTSEPEPQEPIAVGAFARRWVSGSDTLDLVAGTMTETADFEVTSFTEAGADSVIGCKADGKEYVLKLGADGTLGMYNAAEDAEPVRTFMPDAAAFGGVWMPDDPYLYVYYAISPVPDGNGYFGWEMYSQATHESVDMLGTGTTALVFDDQGEAGVVFTGYSYDYPYMTISYDENGTAWCDDGYSAYALKPDAAGIGEAYLTGNGEKILVDFETGKIVYNGTESAFEIKASDYGSALVFSEDGKACYLQRTTTGVYRIDSEGATSVCAAYDPDRLKGVWSNADDSYRITVETDDKIKFGSQEYDLTARVEDGKVVYDFMRYDLRYTIRTIEGIDVAVSVESEMQAASGYYILNDAKQVFVGDYVNNIETLSVSADYSVNLKFLLDGTSTSYAGTFTYKPDLECIVLALGESGMFMLQLEDGAFWVLEEDNGNYAEYSAYYAEEKIPALQEAFSVGLMSETDIYTTGGTAPVSLRFDFENGKVIYNGEEYIYTWGYEFGTFSAYPTMIFVSDLVSDESGNLVDYVYNSLRPFDQGVALESIRMSTGESVYSYFISQSIYSDMIGLSYTYRGPLYDETFTLKDDGSFWISSTDLTDADAAVSPVAYEYTLQRFYDQNGKENIIIAFNPYGNLYLYVYIVDDMYATLFDIVYARTELIGLVGTYYDEAGNTFAVDAHAAILVNGEEVEIQSVSLAPAPSAVYMLGGKRYTASIVSAGVISVTDGTETVTYTLRKFTPSAFVGAYALNGKEIVVSSSAVGINYEPTLKAEVDGSAVTATLAFTADGKQALTFSAFDFSSGMPAMVNYTITLDGQTLTITDGTNTVTAAAADWDYSDFVFTDEKTLTDSTGGTHTFVCLPKLGGKAPLFLYDGASCSQYSVTIDADGAMTLEVTNGVDTFVIEVGADGTVSAGYKPSDIPLPPPPPPPPPAP